MYNIINFETTRYKLLPRVTSVLEYSITCFWDRSAFYVYRKIEKNRQKLLIQKKLREKSVEAIKKINFGNEFSISH